MNIISHSSGTVPANNAPTSLKRPATDVTPPESKPCKLLKSASSTVSIVISKKSNLITNYLFGNGNRVVFQASTGKFIPDDLKHEMMSLYQLSYPHCSEHTQETPINKRNIELVHILPTLAKTDHFFEKLINHTAELFTKIDSHPLLDTKITKINSHPSLDIQMALWDLGPFEKFSDVGKFLDTILEKHNVRHSISFNEKITFKYLLTRFLKMDHNLNADYSIQILDTLSRYFHPDISGKYCELYLHILSKGPLLAKVIRDVWGVNHSATPSIEKKDIVKMSVDQLIKLITKLNENKHEIPKVIDRYQFRQNIALILKSLTNPDQKESLIMTLIKYNEQALLKVLMVRKDFNINKLTIAGETPLIYAIKQRSQGIINFLLKMPDIKKLDHNNSDSNTLDDSLIERPDVNTLGLEGKTPLQIAIGCYSNFFEEHDFKDAYNPFQSVINSLLNCNQLNVDARDSAGMTALYHIATLPKFDAPCFTFAEKLISRGANIDQPVHGHETVGSLLKKKLKS